ncbi:hypothetical protein GW17_00024698 [Ensete ventricosum]|nr:hypothetical protein GW17_00024698 [Ensete ventricosum]
MISSTPNHGQIFIIGADTSRMGVSIILMQDDQQHEEVKIGPENHHSYSPQTQIRLTPLEILSKDNPHSKRRHDYYYRATIVPRRPIPYRDHPKLRIHKGPRTWYQSSVLGIWLPFHSHPLAPHSRPKQFPQLLEDRHHNSTVISTIADHLLISS